MSFEKNLQIYKFCHLPNKLMIKSLVEPGQEKLVGWRNWCGGEIGGVEKLESFPRVKGLVVGASGELSKEYQELLEIVADSRIQQHEHQHRGLPPLPHISGNSCPECAFRVKPASC